MVTLIKRVAPISVFAVMFSAVFSVAALVQWALFYRDFSPYPDFGIVFIILLGGSALLSLGMFALADVWSFRALLFVRFATLLFLAYGYGTNVAMNLTLGLPLIFEIAVYEDYPTNLALGLSYACVSLLSKVPVLLKEPTLRGALDDALTSMVLAVFAAAGSLLTRYRQDAIRFQIESKDLDRAVASLSDASKGYLRFAHETEKRSARNERNRITQELHDSIGYTLTNLVMIIEAAKALVTEDNRRVKELLTTAAEQAQQGLAETRRSLYALRRYGAYEAEGLKCIYELARTFQESTGVQVKLEFANMPSSCGVEADAFIYHFVQEGLTNSFRHGRATMIEVLFWKDEEKISVTLRDNGTGCETITEGIGIIGMREQLGKFGGTLEVRSPPRGFEIAAEIPLRADA